MKLLNWFKHLFKGSHRDKVREARRVLRDVKEC
jgi:hypothetical protein